MVLTKITPTKPSQVWVPLCIVEILSRLQIQKLQFGLSILVRFTSDRIGLISKGGRETQTWFDSFSLSCHQKEREAKEWRTRLSLTPSSSLPPGFTSLPPSLSSSNALGFHFWFFCFQVLSSRLQHQISQTPKPSFSPPNQTKIPMLLLRPDFSFCKVKFHVSGFLLIAFFWFHVVLAGNVWSLESSLQAQFTWETI